MAEADFRLLVVWTNIIKSDDGTGAGSAAALFDDPRVHQFHDPERRVGRLFAPVIKMPNMREVAAARGVEPAQLEKSFGKGYVYGEAAVFDTVFFFPPGVEWGDAVPEPAGWVTQLDPAMFMIDPERFRFGEAMGDEMKRLADVLFERERKTGGAPPPASQRVFDRVVSSVDLARARDRMWLALAEPGRDAAGPRVTVHALSDQGAFEQKADLALPGAVLSDPRLAAAPDGRLLLLCTASDPALPGPGRSLIAASSDGATWTELRAPAGLPGGARVADLAWRDDGVFALVELPGGAELYRSGDGFAYERAPADPEAPAAAGAEALACGADKTFAARLPALPGGALLAGARDAGRDARVLRIAADGTCSTALALPGSAGPGRVALAEHGGELWIAYAAEGPDGGGLYVARADLAGF